MVNFTEVNTTLKDFQFLCTKEADVLEAFGKRWCEINEGQTQYGVNYKPNRFIGIGKPTCPNCGSRLSVRAIKSDEHPGRKILSCVCGYAYAE